MTQAADQTRRCGSALALSAASTGSAAEPHTAMQVHSEEAVPEAKRLGQVQSGWTSTSAVSGQGCLPASQAGRAGERSAARSRSTLSLECLPYTDSGRRCGRGAACLSSSRFSCGHALHQLCHCHAQADWDTSAQAMLPASLTPAVPELGFSSLPGSSGCIQNHHDVPLGEAVLWHQADT